MAALLLGLCGAAPAQDDIDAVEISLDAGAPLRLERFEHDVAAIDIDGKIDEAAWQRMVAYSDLRVVVPDTLAAPEYETRIRMFYTERGLYVSYDMDQPAETLVQRFTQRDAQEDTRDFVTMTLDTSGGGRYGYFMSLALGDSQRDGTVLPERQFKADWDGAWYGATATTETGWSAEFFIPWSQMAMPQEDRVRRMGFYGSRTVGYLNERYAWPVYVSSFYSLQIENYVKVFKGKTGKIFDLTYIDINFSTFFTNAFNCLSCIVRILQILNKTIRTKL